MLKVIVLAAALSPIEASIKDMERLHDVAHDRNSVPAVMCVDQKVSLAKRLYEMQGAGAEKSIADLQAAAYRCFKDGVPAK